MSLAALRRQVGPRHAASRSGRMDLRQGFDSPTGCNMSEYQYVVLQAVDGPLTDEQLTFAERQSSRADVTRWSLSAEYHYSSFRGDVDGLLRRGYDIYLQHTNYGSREIKVRLPYGLPCAKIIWSKYLDGSRLKWTADAKGRGGILTLSPYRETGDLEPLWDVQEHVEAVISVRERLMSGDLRALYVLWLCAADDDYNDPAQAIEPPVPHGIAEAADYGDDVLSFFGLDPLLLVAAGRDVPLAPTTQSEEVSIAQWVASLNLQQARELIHRMLVNDAAAEKARLLAEIRDSQTVDGWPTSDRQCSFSQLLQQTAELRTAEDAKQARKAQAKAQRDAVKAERQRAARMQEMAKAPDKWLRETDRLVELGGTVNYKAAADILHDLREAVGGAKGDKLARRHAAHLVKKHPTLSQMKGSLRKRGLLE